MSNTKHFDRRLMNRARQSLIKHLALANKVLDGSFDMPELAFSLRGKAAGKASLQPYVINLNYALYQQNVMAFLTQVIPHELAHLLVFKRYGKVKPHGVEWQRMMSEVFNLPADVTHQFDLTPVLGEQFKYRCICQEHWLSPIRHHKMLSGETKYLCKACKSELKVDSSPVHM